MGNVNKQGTQDWGNKRFSPRAVWNPCPFIHLACKACCPRLLEKRGREGGVCVKPRPPGLTRSPWASSHAHLDQHFRPGATPGRGKQCEPRRQNHRTSRAEEILEARPSIWTLKGASSGRLPASASLDGSSLTLIPLLEWGGSPFGKHR